MNNGLIQPQGAMMGMSEMAESRFDILGALNRRKWLVLLFAVVGGSLGYLYFLQQTPVYESSVRVFVSLGPTDEVMNRMMLRDGQTDLMTDAILIKTPTVLQDAIQAGGLDKLASFRGNDPVNTLNSGFSATPVSYGREQFLNILELRFRGHNPDDCASAVTAVSAAYIRYLEESQEDTAAGVIDLITDAKDSLMKDLETKEAEYLEFRENATILWQGREVLNVHQQRMTSIEGKITESIVRRTVSQAKLDGIKDAIERGIPRETLALILESGADISTVALSKTLASGEKVEHQLFPLILQYRKMSLELGSDHPLLTSLHDEIEFTRQQLMRQNDALQTSDDQSENAPSDGLTNYVTSLHEQITLMDKEENSMRDLFNKESESARALTEYEARNQTYVNGIDRTERLLNSVISRLEELSIATQHSIGTRTGKIFQAASKGVQVEPSLYRIMVISVLLGSFFGLALGAVAELTDKRFHGPEDVSRELGLPLLGHIRVIKTAEKTEDASGLDPILCCLHRPGSRQAEAFRGIRNSLFFTAYGNDYKVFMITSPSAGDGKSTIAANLAIAIANSGKSTMLLDCDLRRPRVHKIFNIDNHRGTSEFLTEEAELPDIIHQTTVENLAVITCGAKPHNPAEILLSPRYAQLLSELRTRFDFIIIDSPPVLAVSDSGVVATLADGVIITLRLTRHTRHLAHRMLDMLDMLYRGNEESKVIGIIINRLESYSGYGKGGYSGKSYGYEYGYGYGQGTGEYYKDVDVPEKKDLS